MTSPFPVGSWVTINGLPDKYEVIGEEEYRRWCDRTGTPLTLDDLSIYTFVRLGDRLNADIDGWHHSNCTATSPPYRDLFACAVEEFSEDEIDNAKDFAGI